MKASMLYIVYRNFQGNKDLYFWPDFHSSCILIFMVRNVNHHRTVIESTFGSVVLLTGHIVSASDYPSKRTKYFSTFTVLFFSLFIFYHSVILFLPLFALPELAQALYRDVLLQTAFSLMSICLLFFLKRL